MSQQSLLQPNNKVPLNRQGLNGSIERIKLSIDEEYIEEIKKDPEAFQQFRKTGETMFSLFKVLV